MADTALTDFVKESLQSGASRATTEKALLEAGWSKDQVLGALAAFATIQFPIPVPRPSMHLSARDAFHYLVMFSMLYLAAYNLGDLLFQFINLAFPDPALAENVNRLNAKIRYATAALLVSFPVFIFVSSRINRQIRLEPTQRNSAIRKWLTWLTLAIAAGVIVGDLIQLLNSLLSGELTVRVLLKALVMGGISGLVFAYYLWTMHQDDVVLSR